MIKGTSDTYFTLAEFARMLERSEKTIRNWVSEGRIVPCDLCGVTLFRLSAIENLITGDVPRTAPKGRLARRLIGQD